MAQTQQPMGSSPLAMANNMQGQVWRGPVPVAGQGPQPQSPAMSPAAIGNLQAQLGAQNWGQTPQVGDRVAKMQQNLSAIQGMQPNQIPRMPGMQPPMGAPGQGPGGAKAPGTPGGAQQMRQQVARLPGGPPPGAPAAGPGAGKAAGQNPQMRQQIARLPGAPGR